MKCSNLVVSFLFVVVASLAASFPAAGQAPAAGKLILTGDLAVFAGGGKPDNCFLRNRFKRGENVGFRLSAIDGGTDAAAAIMSDHHNVLHLEYVDGKLEHR